MNDTPAPSVTPTARLVTAQWIFERQLGWIGAAEVKVGVIVGINTALLSGLAAAFGSSDAAARMPWTYLFTLVATGASMLAFFCAAMAVMPRTQGPKTSMLFFGRVAELDQAEYQFQLQQLTDEEILADWGAQIHRNAVIARDKYVWVRRSMGWSFCAAASWIAAVGLLVKL